MSTTHRRHSFYPPITPTVYTRRRHPLLRALWGALAGLTILAALVLGTVLLIDQVHVWRSAPEQAYLQGLTAGASTCGRQ